jgi:DNA-binding transcriptional ArsR family regulator
MTIDPSRLRLGNTTKPDTQRRLPRHKAGEKFLKGPIPLDWLSAAARLPGKSLHVAIAIWFTASLNKSATVPLSNIAGLPFGLDRNAKYRALQWLEEAGLILVERKLGRSPVVTLLEFRSEHAEE